MRSLHDDMADPQSSSPPSASPPIKAPTLVSDPALDSDPDPDWMSASPSKRRRPELTYASARLAKRRAVAPTQINPTQRINSLVASFGSPQHAKQPTPMANRRAVTPFKSTSQSVFVGHTSPPPPGPTPAADASEDRSENLHDTASSERSPTPYSSANEQSRDNITDLTETTSPLASAAATELADDVQNNVQNDKSKESTTNGVNTLIQDAASTIPDKNKDSVTSQAAKEAGGGDMHPYLNVLASWAGKYVVIWDGNDPETGMPWRPSLEPKEHFPGEQPVLRVKADNLVDSQRVAAVSKEQEEEEADEGNVQIGDEDNADGNFFVRDVLDSVTFMGKRKGRTFTVYLVDWMPSKGGQEVYDATWEARQDLSVEALKLYETKLKQAQAEKSNRSEDMDTEQT